ncbi:DUF2971 domain-containing protein [Myxococcus sp. CA039A]|uniref:DUF2971 domain-containing protein n=1 Tax=Myxococcus sp. CA039A TaxID=2741737 RepID=UPI00157A6243|nr:DUF2971 domain-containing protein [Myxococcus sp. CA039A]NTX58810.1 DUF2971 domain-containing protein [Myxococcus sp. CA039A]
MQTPTHLTPQMNPDPIYQNDINSIKDQFFSEFSTLDDAPPDTLYHYTDPGGLLGILNTKALWFSRSGFLNDATEATHGLSLIQAALKEKLELKNTRLSASLLQTTERKIGTFLTSNFAPFITCFCASGDLLSQWRGYGSLGGGFAIGFSPNELEARVKTKDRPAILAKVIYDIEHQKSYISRAIDSFCALADSWEVAGWKAESDELIEAADIGLRTALIDAFFRFKHPGFAEENEWRLIVFEKMDHPALSFRSAGPRIIPYFCINMCRITTPPESLPITRIVCGPTVNQELTKQALALRLAQDPGLRDVKVEASLVPFRA